jgi:2'-5' RNA ligase
MRIRCFISIEFPEGLKASIARQTGFLREGEGRDIKWVSPGSLHLTLKFLGYVPEERIEEIGVLLTGAVKGSKPFALQVAGTGVFPSERRPRVIWLGIKGPDSLLKLRQSVEDALEKAGFEKGAEAFSPHLTIGRLKSPRPVLGLVSALSTLKETVFGNIMVGNICLMKSELRPSGSIYTKIEDFWF